MRSGPAAVGKTRGGGAEAAARNDATVQKFLGGGGRGGGRGGGGGGGARPRGAGAAAGAAEPPIEKKKTLVVRAAQAALGFSRRLSSQDFPDGHMAKAEPPTPRAISAMTALRFNPSEDGLCGGTGAGRAGAAPRRPNCGGC